jgi:preprotein translocase subunit SecA
MNRQREVVYSRRQALLEGEEVRKDILDMAYDLVESHFQLHAMEGVHPEEWDLESFATWFSETFRQPLAVPAMPERAALNREEYLRALLKKAELAYEAQEKKLGPEAMRTLERHLVLEAIDDLWKDHLLSMDHLKEGIGLRAYGQKDPLIEYKREGYELFARMMATVKEQVIPLLMRMESASTQEEAAPDFEAEFRNLSESRPNFELPGAAPQGLAENGPARPAAGGPQVALKPIKREYPKVGRNDPCPCGSGKKYKKCHGADA